MDLDAYIQKSAFSALFNVSPVQTLSDTRPPFLQNCIKR